MLLRCALLVLMTVTSASGAWARQRLRAEFQVNTYTTDGQQSAAVVADAYGGFVMAWSSVGQDGDGVGVFGQRFAPNGARLGVEFQINTYTTGHQAWFAYEKPVAAAGSNGYVILWPSDGQDGSTWGIFGRRYDLGGAALGGEFQVNSVTASDQRGMAIDVCPDDSFTVAWHDYGNDGSGWGVFARRFDAAGHALGAQFVVPTVTAGDQLRPAVACDASGTSLVLWTNWPGGSEIRGRRFDAFGQPVSGELLISGHTPNGSENARVVPLPSGYLAAWERYDDTKVQVRRLDSEGSPVGAQVRVGQMGVIGAGFYDVAADVAGAFAVAWSNGREVFAQRFDATGAARGAEFSVNAYTTGWQDTPVMAMDGDGNITIAWDSHDPVAGQDGDGKGVFARRFSSLRPASLRVDVAGNGVLEPGEEVDVRPAWRNEGTVDQSFVAGLRFIEGPYGPTHAITDDAADYGVVAVGTTQGCADCYSVAVSEPERRPGTHWDASVVETLASSTQDVETELLLHVGRSFDDVRTSSPYYPFIETVLHHSVTPGCTATRYCPKQAMHRDEMTSWVLLAKDGGEYQPRLCWPYASLFLDVPSSNPYCAFVEEAARRGVISGCAPGLYCPGTAVTRAQMAVFVLRGLDPALSPPACGTPMFDDVPATSPFCRWIEELARRGVVAGCGGGDYCPDAPVTREQMAPFVALTFGLSLYGP